MTTPYSLLDGWTYYLEAARELPWPACAYRFMSFPASCNSIDFWNEPGGNQQFKFIQVDSNTDSFYLQANNCGTYVSYSDDCNSTVVSMDPEAGKNQIFRFISSGDNLFEYYIEAVGRLKCSNKYLSFPMTCATNAPDSIELGSKVGVDQMFRLYPVYTEESPPIQHVALNVECPDPFVWKSSSSQKYYIQCTGDLLGLGSSTTLEPQSSFTYLGTCLGSSMPSWAQYSDRWAPENYQYKENEKEQELNYVFFSADPGNNGVHRIGWAMSTTGAWTNFASDVLDLGGFSGGDIDAHVFEDTDGKVYLAWKTDDNNIGATSTRVWLQQMSFNSTTGVNLVGSPQVILDSTGLWWADSFIQGGSLIEGPEIVKHSNGYYYLFFAAGKYCEASYAEGVARSKNIWGPWEKMMVPFLSTGLVGVSSSQPVIGPGHASFFNIGVHGPSKDDDWRVVFHASVGNGVCVRYPFIGRFFFGDDDWPYFSISN